VIASSTAARLRAALVAELAERGLTDPAWRSAFATVPREAFVPYYFEPCRGQPGWRLVERDTEWLNGVYSDEALVTQLGGDDTAAEAARRGERSTAAPTSSSSAPSLMAAMLAALEVRDDDHRVLEVGTGTGYNAALLTHRLGGDNTTSVEVDVSTAARARRALASLGYHPKVVCGDGTAGVAEQAPYDRLIATVAVPRVPPAWLEQTRDDALILVPLSCAGHGGLMALLIREPTGGASGRFLAQYGGFMPVRDTLQPSAPTIRPGLLAAAQATDVPPEALNDGHPAAFYLSLRCSSRYQVIQFTPDGRDTETQTWGRSTDGSTFAVVRNEDVITASAEGPLWGEIENAYSEWCALGRPPRERFGVTVDTRQWVWLDHHDQRIVELAQGG
jgi:protein-L-isoaspartate O-methyltransferase